MIDANVMRVGGRGGNSSDYQNGSTRGTLNLSNSDNGERVGASRGLEPHEGRAATLELVGLFSDEMRFRAEARGLDPLENLLDLLGPVTSTKLDSPVIDLDISGIQSVTLEYDLYYKYFDGGDTATVEVWNGTDWQVLWIDPDADHNAHHSFDVTSAGAGYAFNFFAARISRAAFSVNVMAAMLRSDIPASSNAR